MTAWNIDVPSAHSVINRTEAMAEGIQTAGSALHDAVAGAQGVVGSDAVISALASAYDDYARLLVSNAETLAENTLSAVREALSAYQEADLMMAAQAQQNAGVL